MQPEPFYLSIRFWVAVLTTPVGLIVTYLMSQLPFLQIEPGMATEFLAGFVVLGITFIIARTLRNSKVKT